MRLFTLLLATTPLLSLALARGVNSGSGSGGGNGGGNGNGGGDDGSHSILTINGTACATIDNLGGTTVRTDCTPLPTPPPGEEPHTRTDFYTSIGINTTVIFGPGYVDGHDGNHVSTGPVTYPLTSGATATASGAATSTSANAAAAAGSTGSKTASSKTASGTGAAATTAAGNAAQRVKVAGGLLGCVFAVAALGL